MSGFSPVTFYFQLNFSQAIEKEEALFKEISGLAMEMGVEEIIDGSQNNFRHLVPFSIKYSNLVLKNGLTSKDSELVIWCMKILNGNVEDSIKTKNIAVRLLDIDGSHLKSWVFSNAYPIKWAISDQNSDTKKMAIDSLEFAYSSFQ